MSITLCNKLFVSTSRIFYDNKKIDLKILFMNNIFQSLLKIFLNLLSWIRTNCDFENDLNPKMTRTHFLLLLKIIKRKKNEIKLIN